MTTNRWLFLFRSSTFIFLFLICTIDVQGKNNTVSKDCDIYSYIEYLYIQWKSNHWPRKISSRCIGYILLQWAYQMKGALHGKSRIEKNKYLDRKPGISEVMLCKPYLKRRTNRSSLDALGDVFHLLLKLTKVLKKDINWCSLIPTCCQESFYDRTRVLVRELNSLVRQQNRLDARSRVNYEKGYTCDK